MLCLLFFSIIFTTLFTTPLTAKTNSDKKRIAVLQFKTNNVPKYYGKIVRNYFEIAFYNINYLHMLEREQIDKVIKEKKNKKTNSVQNVLTIGKMLSSEFVVVGSVDKLDAKTISVRIINVADAKIISARTEVFDSVENIRRVVEYLVDKTSDDLLFYLESGNIKRPGYDFLSGASHKELLNKNHALGISYGRVFNPFSTQNGLISTINLSYNYYLFYNRSINISFGYGNTTYFNKNSSSSSADAVWNYFDKIKLQCSLISLYSLQLTWNQNFFWNQFFAPFVKGGFGVSQIKYDTEMEINRTAVSKLNSNTIVDIDYQIEQDTSYLVDLIISTGLDVYINSSLFIRTECKYYHTINSVSKKLTSSFDSQQFSVDIKNRNFNLEIGVFWRF